MWKYLLGGEERQQKIKKHCASKGSSVPGWPAKAHFSATFQPRPVQPAQSSAEDALPALWNHRLPVMTERLRSLTNNAWGAAVPHLSAVTKTTNHHIFSCHLQDFPGAQLRQFHTGVHTSLWITMYTWVSPQHTKKNHCKSYILLLLPANSLEMGRCMLTGSRETLYGRAWRMCLHI